MEEKKSAIRKAKLCYVALAGILVVNVLLSSFIFFDLGIEKVREIFLAVGTLMLLSYAVFFPTKLLPSASYLLKNVVYLVAPLILILLVASPYNGVVSIVAYVICMLISLFCAYVSIAFHIKVMRYITEENVNDYVLFENKTYKAHEINIYTFAFIFINFFITMASGMEWTLVAVCYVNLAIGVILNYFRTRAALSDKIKMSHYVLESLSTFLAYTSLVVVNMLDLSSLLYMVSLALLVPTIAMTIMVYRAIDSFMYK